MTWTTARGFDWTELQDARQLHVGLGSFDDDHFGRARLAEVARSGSQLHDVINPCALIG
jgi:hypothetical protein